MKNFDVLLPEQTYTPHMHAAIAAYAGELAGASLTSIMTWNRPESSTC